MGSSLPSLSSSLSSTSKVSEWISQSNPSDTEASTPPTPSSFSTLPTSQSSSSLLSSPTCTSSRKCSPLDSPATSSSLFLAFGMLLNPSAVDPTQPAVSATTSRHQNPGRASLATQCTPFFTLSLCSALAPFSQ